MATGLKIYLYLCANMNELFPLMYNHLTIRHLFAFLAVVGLLLFPLSVTCRANYSHDTLQQTSEVVSSLIKEGKLTTYSMVTRDGRRMVS